MKKFLLTMCVALLSVIAFAQYNVVVVLKDGTEVKYLATDIDSIRIDNFTAVPADQTGLRFEYDESTMTASVKGLTDKEAKEIKIPSQVYYDGNVYDVTEISGIDPDGYFIGFRYCESLTSIEIPNSVTSIGNFAFIYCYNLTSIEIPNSVTTIGYGAFADCTSLTSIVIPNSVTYIEEGAFASCTSLTSIEIPNSVTYIGGRAFVDCTSLTSIVVDKDNKVYDSRENCNAIIKTASNTLIAGCQNTVIPNSVTSIGEGAFGGCSLTSIEIPNSVTSIGQYAFGGCYNLTSIEIPNSVTTIGEDAFYDCGLTSIEIGNSVTTIGRRAFVGCSNLTSIVIPESVTKIGDYAFVDCISLTSIEIPESVTTIGIGAFKGCSKLKTARVPKGLDIRDASFPSTCEIELYDPLTGETVIPADQTGLLFKYDESTMTATVYGPANENRDAKEIKIPSQVYYDGNVYDVTEISGIDPDGYFIGFRYCESLTSIEIPNSVTSIGTSAFEGCRSLTSIEIPNSVTEIGGWAFSYCESLTSIEIPNSVTSIGGYAFRDCTSLTSIVIPNSVTEIGNFAFSGCTSLKTARVPLSLKDKIPSNAFPSTCEIEWY